MSSKLLGAEMGEKMKENQGRRRRAFATAGVVLFSILALAAGAAAGTFGNTSPGSSSGAPGAGFKFGSVYTLSDTATGPMTFFFYATPGELSQSFVPAVYATDGSGNPTSRVAVGTQVMVTPAAGAGWFQSTLSLTSGSSLAPGNYLLALLAGDTGGQAQIGFDPGSGVFNTQADTTNPSDPFGPVLGSADQQLSFYVEYATAGTPGAPAPFRGEPARGGYCSATGDTDLSGNPIIPGTFLNLRLGQPRGDVHYLGATPAFYVEGIGLTCDPPSSAYTSAGEPLVDQTGKAAPPGTTDEGTIYPYFKKTG
jgi:hypothetical protein